MRAKYKEQSPKQTYSIKGNAYDRNRKPEDVHTSRPNVPYIL